MKTAKLDPELNLFVCDNWKKTARTIFKNHQATREIFVPCWEPAHNEGDWKRVWTNKARWRATESISRFFVEKEDGSALTLRATAWANEPRCDLTMVIEQSFPSIQDAVRAYTARDIKTSREFMRFERRIENEFAELNDRQKVFWIYSEWIDWTRRNEICWGSMPWTVKRRILLRVSDLDAAIHNALTEIGLQFKDNEDAKLLGSIMSYATPYNLCHDHVELWR